MHPLPCYLQHFQSCPTFYQLFFAQFLSAKSKYFIKRNFNKVITCQCTKTIYIEQLKIILQKTKQNELKKLISPLNFRQLKHKMSNLQQIQNQQNSKVFQFLEQVNQKIFVKYFQANTSRKTHIITFGILAFKSTGQVIKVKNQSLKIDLVRMILKLNSIILETGFKFKIDPLSGTLILQSSFFINLTNNYGQKQKELLIEQDIQSLKKEILQKYENSVKLRQTFFKIIDFIQNGTSFHNKHQNMSQLTRLAYNSSFYAWNSPILNDYACENKSASQIKKLQLWPDQQQNQGQYSFSSNGKQDSQVTSDQNQQNQQIKQVIKDGNRPTFTQFYLKNRKLYNQISIISESAESTQDLQIQQRNINLMRQFFISQNQDQILYEKYLKPHENYKTAQKIQFPKSQIQRISKNNEKQINKYKQFELTVEMSERLKQTIKLISVLAASNQSLSQSVSSSSDQQNQYFEQKKVVLRAFLDSNQISISKSTKWAVIVHLVQNIYAQFLNGESKLKTFYSDNSIIKVCKSLALESCSKKFEALNFLSKNSSNRQNHFSYHSTPKKDCQNLNQEQLKNHIIKGQEEEQRKVASFLLNLISGIIFPQTMLINRTVDSKVKIFKGKNFNILSIQKWIDGAMQKLKNTSLQLQSVLLYLYQKSKVFKKGPFVDWIVIISQILNSKIQMNEI